MKTISSCFLGIIIFAAITLLNGACLIMNIADGRWGWFTYDVVALVTGILIIRWLYRQAKEYELVILDAVRNLYMFQSIRAFKDFLEARENETTDTDGELEKH